MSDSHKHVTPPGGDGSPALVSGHAADTTGTDTAAAVASGAGAGVGAGAGASSGGGAENGAGAGISAPTVVNIGVDDDAGAASARASVPGGCHGLGTATDAGLFTSFCAAAATEGGHTVWDVTAGGIYPGTDATGAPLRGDITAGDAKRFGRFCMFWRLATADEKLVPLYRQLVERERRAEV